MYPRTVIVKYDREVEIWPMTADDAPALLAFYRSLPPEDLLYLREDVTTPESMTRWVESIESEQGWHLLAGYEGRIIADGELDHQFYGWSRHVGELRLVIDPAFRGSGLSLLIAREVLAQAADEALHKVMVQMTVDQQAAIHMCKKLGFRHEAILTEHVQDQHGQLRDLVIMGYFINDFLGQYDSQRTLTSGGDLLL
ncbi:MAG: N-acetyltransferase family protein [Candidatus Tectimicrobiota bacterium]